MQVGLSSTQRPAGIGKSYIGTMGIYGTPLPNLPRAWLTYSAHIFHLGSYFSRGTYVTCEEMRSKAMRRYKGRPVTWKGGFQDVHSAVLLTFENEELIDVEPSMGRQGMIHDLARQSVKSFAIQADFMGTECRAKLMEEIEKMGPEWLAVKALAIRAIEGCTNRDENTIPDCPEGARKERICPGCIRSATPGKTTTVSVTCDECRTELCVPCDFLHHQDVEGEHRRNPLPGVKLSEAQTKVLKMLTPKARTVAPPQELSRAELAMQEEEMNPNVMAMLKPGTRMVTAGNVMRNTIPRPQVSRTVVMTPTRITMNKMPATSDEITRFMNTGPPGAPASHMHGWELRDSTYDGSFTVEPATLPTEQPRRILLTNRKHNRPAITPTPIRSAETPIRPIEITLTPDRPVETTIEPTSNATIHIFPFIPPVTIDKPEALTTAERMANYLAADDAVDPEALRIPPPRINRSALQASAINQPGPSRLNTMAPTRYASPRVDPFSFDFRIYPDEPLFVQKYIAVDPHAKPEEPFDPNWTSKNIMEGLQLNNPVRTTKATVDGRPVEDPMSAYNEPHKGDKRKADGEDEGGHPQKKGSKTTSGRSWVSIMPEVREEEEEEVMEEDLRTEEASGEGWTSTRDFRGIPSEATEAALNLMCIRCGQWSNTWRCDCRHSGGYAVIRGIPGYLEESVRQFTDMETSLPKEFAKLGDLLTTEALEAIVGEESGVVTTAIDCEGWQGYFPTKVHDRFPNEDLTGHLRKIAIEKMYHDFCVQVAGVEQHGGGRRTAFNINFRIPEKAIPLIHTPAAHKTMQSLRERAVTG